MKASAAPRTILATACAMAAMSCFALAQDVVVQKDNQRREGEIVGISDGKLKIKIGPAETSIAMNQVASVTKAPPKAYDDAVAAWQRGDTQKTLSLLKPLLDSFGGLPTPWAERASAMLGEAYLATDQLPAAEAAFATFKKNYPESASASEIGLARLAVAKKDFATAKTKLTPIIANAEKVATGGGTGSESYGQAFYLMGLVRENEGAFPEALEAYLTAVTVFYNDQAVVAKAQERADSLIKEKQTIVP